MPHETYVTGIAWRVYAGVLGLLVGALCLFQVGPGPPPATALGVGGQPVVCDSSAEIDTAASGNTELVALTTGDVVYVCGYNFIAAGTVTVQLVYGTGTACATGETDLTGAMPLTTQTGVSYGGGVGMVTKGAVSNAVCIELSAAVSVTGILTYAKY